MTIRHNGRRPGGGKLSRTNVQSAGIHRRSILPNLMGVTGTEPMTNLVRYHPIIPKSSHAQFDISRNTAAESKSFGWFAKTIQIRDSSPKAFAEHGMMQIYSISVCVMPFTSSVDTSHDGECLSSTCGAFVDVSEGNVGNVNFDSEKLLLATQRLKRFAKTANDHSR